MDKEQLADAAHPVEELPMPIQYAGFWIRLAAVILDSLLLWTLTVLLFDPMRRVIGVQDQIVSIVDLLEIAAGLIYYVILTYLYGQTLGKMALGIKVIHQEGHQLTLGQVILREVAGKLISALVLFIGYLAASFDSKKRAWHDRIANTCVIKNTK